MAKRLQAKKITEALQKAQRVGEVEERFSISGCEVVLRSLTPEEFESVITETEDLDEGLPYINSFKKGHICRSLVEVNGESLREYDFVDVEVESTDIATKQVTQKVVALERHRFVLEYILATWSREAIDVSYRKFLDLTSKSEAEAAKGVEFTLPDETPEEKYRRLLIETKEIEAQIPIELATRILDEVGYMTKSSKEELDHVDQVLSKVAEDTSDELQEELQREPVPVEAPASSTDLRSMLQSRVPLNQRSVAIPVPVPQPVMTQTPDPQPAPRVVSGPALPITPEVRRRAQEISALEFGMGLDSMDPGPALQGGTSYTVPPHLSEGAQLLSEPAVRVDPNGVNTILDQPPAVGINPRYKPQPKY
jgi:hypothetical protein